MDTILIREINIDWCFTYEFNTKWLVEECKITQFKNIIKKIFIASSSFMELDSLYDTILHECVETKQNPEKKKLNMLLNKKLKYLKGVGCFE